MIKKYCGENKIISYCNSMTYWVTEQCTHCGYNTCACTALGYKQEARIDCTVNELAKALFQTDKDVIAFIENVSEIKHNNCESSKNKAFQIAWERNESGWATRALEKAALIKSVL